jgi:hypothetical protein
MRTLTGIKPGENQHLCEIRLTFKKEKQVCDEDGG